MNRPRTDSTTTLPKPRSDRSPASGAGIAVSSVVFVGLVTPISYRPRRSRARVRYLHPWRRTSPGGAMLEQSLWRAHSVPRLPSKPLPKEVDVVVIGAGI